jgi:hypothetical protein
MNNRRKNPWRYLNISIAIGTLAGIFVTPILAEVFIEMGLLVPAAVVASGGLLAVAGILYALGAAMAVGIVFGGMVFGLMCASFAIYERCTRPEKLELVEKKEIKIKVAPLGLPPVKPFYVEEKLRDGNVYLIDGDQVAQEKVEAICEKLKTIKKSQIFPFFMDVCAMKKEARDRTLRAHYKLFSKFENEDDEYSIIHSNHTMDDETVRIIRCAVRQEKGLEVEVVDPVLKLK